MKRFGEDLYGQNGLSDTCFDFLLDIDEGVRNGSFKNFLNTVFSPFFKRR